MKLWLDDVRKPPDSTWTWAKNYDEAIQSLESAEFFGADFVWSELSLDHDLGDTSPSGYDLLCWLEEWVVRMRLVDIPVIHIHSANPVGAARMRLAIRAIQKIADGNRL